MSLSQEDFQSLFRLERAVEKELDPKEKRNNNPFYVSAETEGYDSKIDLGVEDNIDALIEGVDFDKILTSNDLKCLESGNDFINENFSNLREYDHLNLLKFRSLLREEESPTDLFIPGEEVKGMLAEKSQILSKVSEDKLRPLKKLIEKVLQNDVNSKEKMLKNIVIPLVFRKPLVENQSQKTHTSLFSVKLHLAQSENVKSDTVEVPFLDVTRIQAGEELPVYPYIEILKAVPCSIDMFLSFLSHDGILHYGKIDTLELQFKDFFYPLDLSAEVKANIVNSIKELGVIELGYLSAREYESLISVAVFNYYWQGLEFETVKTVEQKGKEARRGIERLFRTYFIHEIYYCKSEELETEEKIANLLFPLGPRRVLLNQDLRDNPLGEVVRMYIFVPPA